MQYSALQVSQAECVGQPGSQQQVTALGHQLLLQSQFRKLYFIIQLIKSKFKYPTTFQVNKKSM